MSFQGGPNTGDHVDIMGNHDVIADVLKVVAGQGRTLEDRIVSNLHQIVARTNL
jgi:phospholipid:diacylglycerol acyltransferase